jgi:hypothetical protein
MEVNLLDVFIGVVAAGGAWFAYMCGHSDGCKTNSCFRGNKLKEPQDV